MAAFDKEAWLRRAWERHVRSLARDSSPTYWTECLSIDDLAAVVDWCAQRGLEVDFRKKSGAVYHIGQKKITVSAQLRPARQLAFLLHECGHHLIGHEEHHERFGMGYPQTDPEVTKTFHHRVACLEEELEAWHRGWKLAERLGLRLTRAKFDEVRLECIRTYISWSLRPKSYPEA